MEEIRQLVSQDRLLDVCKKLNDISKTEPLKNQIALLLSRLTRINKKENLGIISHEEVNIERNKISNSLLELASEIIQYPSTQKEQNSQVLEEKIDALFKGMKQLKENYKKLLDDKNSTLHFSLTQKYPDGYTLFGMYEGNFIYSPNNNDIERKVSVDWKNTTLTKDKRGKRYILHMKDLKWNQSYLKGGSLNIKIGEFETFFPLDISQGEKYPLRIVHLVGQSNLYIEVLEDGSKGRLIFLLGFTT